MGCDDLAASPVRRTRSAGRHPVSALMSVSGEPTWGTSDSGCDHSLSVSKPCHSSIIAARQVQNHATMIHCRRRPASRWSMSVNSHAAGDDWQHEQLRRIRCDRIARRPEVLVVDDDGSESTSRFSRRGSGSRTFLAFWSAYCCGVSAGIANSFRVSGHAASCRAVWLRRCHRRRSLAPPRFGSAALHSPTAAQCPVRRRRSSPVAGEVVAPANVTPAG